MFKITRTYLAAFTALTAATLAVVIGVNSGTPETAPAFDRNGIPACTAPDGSTQAVCYWDSARAGDRAIRGDAIVFNHGTTAYYPKTGEIVVWSDETNDVIIRKITEGES